MPRAILVLKVKALLATLTEPERLVLADPYNTEPRVTGLIISKSKNDVHFLKRAESSFRVEEVHDRNDGEVRCSKNDPGAVADVVERNGCDEDNTT